jgi:hypothetical protein
MWMPNTVLVLFLAVGAEPAEPMNGERARAEAEYREAESETNKMELLFKDQRVKARRELTEKEESLRAAEHAAFLIEAKTLARITQLEKTMTITLPGATEAVRAREELKQFRAAEAEQKVLVEKARKEVVEGEEALRLLERQQDLQRRKSNGRLDAAAARLWQVPSRPGADAEQRLHELEKKMDALLRELGELRREIRRLQKEPSP